MANEPLRTGVFYHIYNRGNNHENLFVERRNYPFFMQLYAKHVLPVAETFAWCLLPNHFHLLIRTRTPDEQAACWRDLTADDAAALPFKLREPSLAFRNLFIAYTRAFNIATGRTGTLFERPFHRKPIDTDAYFQNLIVYIHRNPQKHRLVDDFRDWPWSSYGAYLSQKASHVARGRGLDWFGGAPHFAAAHLHDVDGAVLRPLLPYGDEI